MKTAALVSVLFAATAPAQHWSLHHHGHSCGAALSAHLVQHAHQVSVQFNLHTTPNSLAVLAIGHAAPAPIPLPGGSCHFGVSPAGTMLGITDSHGNIHFGFHAPHVVPVSVLFQGGVVRLGPHGLTAGSSNVVELVGT